MRTPPAAPPVRCREVCAAVAAAMTSALDASTLTPEERAQLDPLLNEVLLPFWNTHCADDPEAQAYIQARAAHYLAGATGRARSRPRSAS